jgi:molybdenum-dependent DNA-binding transcriptional regulator ModE
MDTKPWRQRVREEDELLEQLRIQVSQSAKRRAAALAEGVAELGSVYKVAKDLGKPWTTVAQAIKKHGPAGTSPDTTE